MSGRALAVDAVCSGRPGPKAFDKPADASHGWPLIQEDFALADRDITQLLLTLLQGFYWFDEGLQNYLRAKGWPAVTRPQSMVMANIVLGICQPSGIARRLGVSRQAIHTTLGQMIDLNVIALVDDPASGRAKIVTLTDMGARMRLDAQAAMQVMAEELGRRIGADALLETAHLLARDWGPAMTFPTVEGNAGE